ncbi:hypothetical protein CBI38_30100 [Rhodococcus oxybenzonivorans]|uniref:Uncharacterized protein n=1 Tax=Rhodococcus oxybenzonivorans TaxID=1990687 RepID=A0A2S2C2P7_9NOCA|nr:hypothetical protein CBI38_30100 [Rhodococcus oxybenzonivorans]
MDATDGFREEELRTGRGTVYALPPLTDVDHVHTEQHSGFGEQNLESSLVLKRRGGDLTNVSVANENRAVGLRGVLWCNSRST